MQRTKETMMRKRKNTVVYMTLDFSLSTEVFLTSTVVRVVIRKKKEEQQNDKKCIKVCVSLSIAE
jgi:hypothetical protein